MKKLAELLLAYPNENLNKEDLKNEIILQFDLIKSEIMPDHFKDAVKENVIFQMQKNILTKEEAIKHIEALVSLKFK